MKNRKLTEKRLLFIKKILFVLTILLLIYHVGWTIFILAYRHHIGDVYIKYVHNIQKLQNCENNIEIPLVLRYSINYKRIEVGRNNISSINCDIVFPAPQDIVPAVGCVV